MKSNKFLKLITAYSLLVGSSVIYFYFGFVNKFYARHRIYYIRDFRESNGHYYFLILTLMIIGLAVLFIAYAKYDNNLMEVYKNEKYDIQKKGNMFSTARNIQYVILVAALIYFIRTTVLAFTLNDNMAFVDLMSTTLIIVAYELQLVYFIAFSGIQVHEYFVNRNKHYY